MPALRHAVVTGFPYDEGNSVEMVRALAPQLRVYWLVSEDLDSVPWVLAGAEARHRIRCLRKNSVPAYLAYLTARYVFFTHGLFGSPRPPRHKVVVNMWHGDGPKRSKRFSDVRSTFAVAGTQLWGRQRPLYFGVSKEGVLVTGHPRVDQFARPADEEAMSRLGLDPDRPLVLWMPTYRHTEYKGHRLADVRNWMDAPALSRSDAVRHLTEEVAAVAGRVKVTVAIKPHPLDADRYASMDVPVISAEDLRRERVTLYQLVGRTRGLITDYSSVWTDYLAMDRPIAFYCPDLADYEATRGLNVEAYPDLIPGPLLESVEDFERFLRECLNESVESRERRARSKVLIGAETRLGASNRLLEAVGITTPPTRAGWGGAGDAG